jgi:hypothetical protein
MGLVGRMDRVAPRGVARAVVVPEATVQTMTAPEVVVLEAIGADLRRPDANSIRKNEQGHVRG